MNADEALQWGFYNKILAPDELLSSATETAGKLANGPTIAHAATKACLHAEWSMSVDEAIDHEAKIQAACMNTGDFVRAYQAFSNKQKPVFEGT